MVFGIGLVLAEAKQEKGSEVYLVLYQVKEMEEKLVKLRGGITLVRPEDKKAVEEMYSDKINQWRRRKRMFKDIWDAITENSPKDPKEFKVQNHYILACLL